MGGMKDLFGDTPFLPRGPEQITRRSDPHTSFQAGRTVLPRLRELQREVYNVLAKFPDGLTDLELEEKCGSHGSTYRTRRAELVELGIVIDTGQTRLQRGRNRKIWKAKCWCL
jgi:hypothetical protein